MPRRPPTALVAVLLTVLAACSGPSDGPSTTAPDIPTTAPAPIATTTTTTAPPATTPSATSTTTERSGPSRQELVYDHFVETVPVQAGVEADVHAPEERGPWPVIVTVHGGGWFLGEPAAMGPLADGLAARGAVVVNTGYRTAGDGGGFPQSVDDVACAVALAREVAPAFTTTPDRVVIVGHSAGAHLASLVAVAPGTFGSGCPYTGSRAVDGFVGLAGPYDTDRFDFLLAPWFGTRFDEDPGPWEEGNPYTYLATAPDIPYLLIHGDEDQVVPAVFSEEFAAALEDAGLDVTLEILPRADHGVVNAPLVVGDRIAAFATGS